MERTVKQMFYHSKAWGDCRKSYIVQHPLCERCLAKGQIVPSYIVHHKVYLTDDNLNNPEIALNHDNLEALCFTCHNQIHFKEESKHRWSFVNDELTIIDD